MDKEYELGRLSASVTGLDRSVNTLAEEVRELRAQLDEIKMFRSKVAGMAAAISVVVSVGGALLGKAVDLWAR